MNRASQESFSFMISIGFAIFLFLVFSGIIISNQASANNAYELMTERSINEKLAKAVHNSFLSGPGTSTNVTLEDISNNYTILIRPGNTILNSDLGSITNPTNAFSVYDTQVRNGQVRVINQGGIINVTQV